MTTTKKIILIILLVTLGSILLLGLFLTHRPRLQIPRSPAVEYLEEQYQRSVLQKEIVQNQKIIAQTELDIEHIPRKASLKFWTIIGVLSLTGVVFLVVGLSYSKVIVDKGTTVMVQINEHCHFPVLHKDISRLYHMFRDIGLEQADAESLHKAFSMNQAITDQHIQVSKAFKSQVPAGQLTAAPATGPSKRVQYPSFKELYRSQALTNNGSGFLVGMTPQNTPQYRTLASLKSLAIGGRQGSGKTFTMAYFLAILVRFYQAKAIMIDPHKTHRTESLSALIDPLALLDYVTVYDTIDLHVALDQIEGHFTRRMNSTESTDRPMVFVIDEMSPLLRNVKTSPIFLRLVTFLERATQETRKTNITFIGGAHTWDARQFKNLAYIRNSFNSCLLHRMKPNEVSFFFKETYEQKKIKQISGPGDALIQIDFDTELEQVHIPLIQKADIQQIALDVESSPRSENVAPASFCEAREDILPNSDHIIKMLQEQREDSGAKMKWTKEFSQGAGISESLLNSVLTGHRELTQDNLELCWRYLSERKSSNSH